MNMTEAEKNFSSLVDRVHAEGIIVDLERENKVIARLMPVHPPSSLMISRLNSFLRELPSLNDDAGPFSQDLRKIRNEFQSEANPWD